MNNRVNCPQRDEQIRFGDNEKGRSANFKKAVSTTDDFLPSKIVHQIFQRNAANYSIIKLPYTNLEHIEVYLTPQLASEMLKHNQKDLAHRRISYIKILKYVDEITSGRLSLTGDPIIISDKGNIIKGHDVLHAAIKADVGFIATITYGVQDNLAFPCESSYCMCFITKKSFAS
ncbi:hypothetical protein [Photobacterium leiognathi]|uniref:hypothetical protein n=1 Tax=Photobacterium leiognathi TaxID=553611 RepID=UPI0027390B0E|nr:hypothetical protein [Photobacterium leiognathi]